MSNPIQADMYIPRNPQDIVSEPVRVGSWRNRAGGREVSGSVRVGSWRNTPAESAAVPPARPVRQADIPRTVAEPVPPPARPARQADIPRTEEVHNPNNILNGRARTAGHPRNSENMLNSRSRTRTVRLDPLPDTGRPAGAAGTALFGNPDSGAPRGQEALPERPFAGGVRERIPFPATPRRRDRLRFPLTSAAVLAFFRRWLPILLILAAVVLVIANFSTVMEMFSSFLGTFALFFFVLLFLFRNNANMAWVIGGAAISSILVIMIRANVFGIGAVISGLLGNIFGAILPFLLLSLLFWWVAAMLRGR